MNYGHSEHFPYPTEEDIETLLAAVDAVNDLPDGKEIIGKSHIICHVMWFNNRVEEEELSFAEAAKRYCPGKSKNAVITVWDGIEALTFTHEENISPEQKDRIQKELNSWLTSKGHDNQFYAIT